jgi:hypothetical protein
MQRIEVIEKEEYSGKGQSILTSFSTCSIELDYKYCPSMRPKIWRGLPAVSQYGSKSLSENEIAEPAYKPRRHNECYAWGAVLAMPSSRKMQVITWPC